MTWKVPSSDAELSTERLASVLLHLSGRDDRMKLPAETVRWARQHGWLNRTGEPTWEARRVVASLARDLGGDETARVTH